MNEKNVCEENKVINGIYVNIDQSGSLILKNCIVGNVSVFLECKELVIENCVIDKFIAVGTRFNGACTIRNSIFKDEFSVGGGGHNKKELRIEGNVFGCFADFYDAYFEGHFVMVNNIFRKGCNILGFKGQITEVKFESGASIENNMGVLDSELSL